MSKPDLRWPDAPPRLKRAPGFGVALATTHADGDADITLRETCLDIVQVTARAGKRDALAGELRAKPKLPLPDAGKSVEADDLTVIGVGPMSWRVLSAPLPDGQLMRRITAAAGANAAIIDIGHGLATLEMSGPAAREALSRVCRLDLDPVIFRPGDAAETIMAQMPVMLWRKVATDVFGLAVPLTFAHSFAHALTGACRPFGLAVEPLQD